VKLLQPKLKNEIYLNATLAYCTTCNKTEFARITANNEGVFMQRICPVAIPEPVKLASDYKWYIERMQEPQSINKSDHSCKSKRGCPQDCGLCEWHTASIKLPVFSITNDCNLDCPICFTYNRPDIKYYKSPEDTQKILDHIFDKKDKRQIINLTGGEPTLHPQLLDILNRCRDKGIERITMNTNGLRIAANPDFAQQIKDSGVQVVLSLDTLDKEKCIKIHGKDITQQKLKTLEILEKLEIPTTILSVCIKEVNEEEVADIAETYLKKDFVKSITIQNMTFTGKNGSNFYPRKHITIDEIEKLLAKKPDFSESDFFPLASYHPLCYSVAYYIVSNGKILPLTKLIDKQTLTIVTADLYYLEPDSELTRNFVDGINRLWADGYDEDYIMELKKLIKEIHPTNGEISNERRKEILEKKIKSIYIHPHMDADNFDIDRVCRCGDIVPDETGKMIPACSYNLLYRQNDPRFWVE
jgi:7,8-dihydro-6-hydroxymethylpterin dimethyltransferase